MARGTHWGQKLVRKQRQSEPGGSGQQEYLTDRSFGLDGKSTAPL